MKINKYLSWLMAVVPALMLTLSFSSCKDDDDDNGPVVTPAVTLTAGEATESSVSFTVSPADADKCAYVCVEKTSDALPAAAAILAEGTTVAADKDSQITVSDLAPNTTYVIAAAASNGTTVGEVVKIEMLTSVGTPTVELAEGEVTDASAVVNVTTQYAASGAWTFVGKDDELPAAAAVLENGTAFEVTDNAAEIVLSDLDPETDYRIAVVAANGDKVSEVADIVVTTVKGDYDRNFVAFEGALNYYGNLQGAGTGDYYVGLSNEEQTQMFFFDLYGPRAIDPDKAVLPDGTYRWDAENSFAEFTCCNPEYSNYYYFDPEQDGENYVAFSDVVLTVTNSETATKIVAMVTLETGEKVRCAFEGQLVTSNESGDLRLIGEDVADLKFTYAEGYYHGDYYESGTGNFALNFANVPISNGYLTEPGDLLFVDLSTTLFENPKDAVLEEGTYTISADHIKGTFMPCKVVDVPSFGYSFATGTYCERMNADYEYFYAIVTGGTVTVAKSGDGYKLDFDFETNDGHTFKASYEGELPIENLAGGPSDESTLTGDYEIDFEWVKTATLYYYGDYYKNGMDNWTLLISNGKEGSDAFQAEFLSPKAGLASGFPAGYYNPLETLDTQSQYFIPGTMTSDGLAGTWYVGGLTADGEATKYAPAKTGSIYVMPRGGDKYMFVIDCYDKLEGGNNFSAMWNGSVTVVDESGSEASAPRVLAAPLVQKFDRAVSCESVAADRFKKRPRPTVTLFR